MQYSLRTLLILLALAPPVMAWLLMGHPAVVMLLIVGVLEVGLLLWLDEFQKVAPSPCKPLVRVRFTIRDLLVISSIAVISLLVGLGLWAANSAVELITVAALFVFGSACYGLGAYIHSGRQEHTAASVPVEAGHGDDATQTMQESCHSASNARP